MVHLDYSDTIPQILSKVMDEQFNSFHKNSSEFQVLLKEQKIEEIDHVTYYNFMNSTALENAFNESDLVLCRSGYTSIMDLARLQKKAFFIPTPGQYEQEYLAKKLKKEGLVPYAKQADFKIENLCEVQLYLGLNTFNSNLNWKNLFEVFNAKKT